MENLRRIRHLTYGCVCFLWLMGSLGCEDKGHYRLEWRFEESEIDSPLVCSKRGVEKLRVKVYHTGTTELVVTHEIPCYPPERSRAMQTGVYDLKIEAVRFDGEVFRDPTNNEQLMIFWKDGVRISAGKSTPLEVTFTRVPQCLDGVDNDRDGSVDSGDQGCWEVDEDGEPVFDEDGNPLYLPFDDDESQTQDASPLE